MTQSYKVLLPINQNYDKIWEETRHPFYIFIQIKKISEMQDNSACAWCVLIVLIFPLTILLPLSIMSMMRALSY